MSAGLCKLPVPAVLLANGFTRVFVQPVSNWEPLDEARIYEFADRRGRWLVVRDEKYVRGVTRYAIQTVLGEHLDSPWGYHVTDLGVPFRHCSFAVAVLARAARSTRRRQRLTPSCRHCWTARCILPRSREGIWRFRARRFLTPGTVR